MVKIRYASEVDIEFWLSLDSHISESELMLKIRDRRGYVVCDVDKPIGILRYNLFWDVIPFLTFIYFREENRGNGYGEQAMLFWENEMRELGYSMVITSTQVDEQAQHFYRKLGYQDRGCLVLDNTPFEQPQEMFMVKNL